MADALSSTIFTVGYETRYEFEGVRFDSTPSRVVPTREHAVEPRNFAWAQMLREGRMPDLLAHFPHAIGFAEIRPALQKFVHLLEESHSQVRSDWETIKSIPPTETEKELLRQVEEMVQAGEVPKKERVN